MIFAAGLLVLGLATALSAPTLLTRGTWQLKHPRAALTAWFGTLFFGLLLLASALLSTLLAAISANPVTAAYESTALTIAGWLGLGGLGAVFTFVFSAAEPLVFSYREQLSSLPRVAISREDRGTYTLARFEHDEAFAVAVPGRHPEVMMSTACEEILTPHQVEAVLAHELAHLRQKHGWSVRIAEVNANCVRWLPAGRTLRRATLLLVELAADDAAARSAGPAQLANALATLSEATGDPSLDVRAERLAAKRWKPRASQTFAVSPRTRAS